MRTWFLLVLLLLCLALFPAHGANRHYGSGTDPMNELQMHWGDAFHGYAVSGCTLPTSGTTSTTIASCKAYARDPGTPTLLYFEDTSARAITFSGGDGTYYVIGHSEIAALVTGWTRVPGTHYLSQLAATQPVLPAKGLWLARVTVLTGALTAVADLRLSSPTGVNSVTDPLFGAIPDDTTDDSPAIQLALTNLAGRGGGTLLFPGPGTYLLATGVTVPSATTLTGNGTRAPILRATAAMGNLINYDTGSATLGQRGGMLNMTLDGANYANHCIRYDSWDSPFLRDMDMHHCIKAGVIVESQRTNSNTDFLTISNVSLAQSQSMPRVVSTPHFLYCPDTQTDTAGTNLGGHCDNIRVFSSRHAHIGAKANGYGGRADSIRLVRPTRFFINNFSWGVASGLETDMDSVIYITAGQNAWTTKTFGRIIIHDLHGEHSTPSGGVTHPGRGNIVIDNDWNGADPAQPVTLTGVTISNHGSPIAQADKHIVDILSTGTNANNSIRNVIIDTPHTRCDSSGALPVINILSPKVERTTIRVNGRNGALDTCLVDQGIWTIINNMRYDNLGVGLAPSVTEGEVGQQFWNSDDNRVYQGPMTAATAPFFLGGPSVVDTLAVWVTWDNQNPSLGQLPGFTYILSVHVHATVAFNSDGTDLVSVGHDANVNGVAGAIDVASITPVSPAVGSMAGYNATRALEIYYVNGGTEPTVGKALVVVQFVRVPPSP